VARSSVRYLRGGPLGAAVSTRKRAWNCGTAMESIV